MAAGAGEPELVEICTTDTITKLLPAHRGQMVVAGSHGGIYAGWCAAKGGARAVILNDAGGGKDQAGTASLPFPDEIGLAAATADAQSCRIADAADMLASGIIRAVNRTAAALGCAPGQTVQDCALVEGQPDKVVPPGVFAAYFHDAGGAKGGSGHTRLASLDALGVVAGTVAAGGARVGDARSWHGGGVLSHVNGTARERGGRVGMALHAFIDTLRQA